MLQPIQQFLPALKGGADLAGLASGQVETLAESFPVTMSGDAWQSAAFFVIRQRANAQSWHEISEFLKTQELAAHGLRLIPARSAAGSMGGVAASGVAARSAPVGNHGDNLKLTTGGGV